MKIVVTTPTGHVGRHVTAMLVRAGLRPTVLVRDPERLDPSIRDLVNAEIVDLNDGDRVVEATKGADALFWVHPFAATDDPIRSYADLGAIVALAVRENGIARTVFQSSVGAEKRHGVGEIDGLAITEQLLDEVASTTDAAVLHLRCGYFFTNLELAINDVRAGITQVIMPLDQPMPWVAPRDIAEVAVSRLLAGWKGRTVQAVHGPADLTWTQAAQIVADAIGQPFRAERISDEQLRAGMVEAGLSDGLIDGLLGMSTGLRDDFVPEQPRDATTTTPTTLASWAYDELRPQMA